MCVCVCGGGGKGMSGIHLYLLSDSQIYKILRHILELKVQMTKIKISVSSLKF